MNSDNLNLKDKYYYYKEKIYIYFKTIYLNDNELKCFIKAFYFSIRLSVIFLIFNTIFTIIRLM